MATMIGMKRKATETYECQKCGKKVTISGYLSYDLEGNLNKNKYRYCDKCMDEIKNGRV